MTKHATIKVQGIVQGVGFRPFINVLANSMNLKGTVLNLGNAGVVIEVEGDVNKIKQFIKRIESEKPRISSIDKLEVIWSDDLRRYENFKILKSRDAKGESLVLPPDLSICDECLDEFNDENNYRYYEYPFIACTECGPRFTSVIDLPYDRPRTTMKDFPLCEHCLKEYTTLGNRRFHAQTFACKLCGPKLFLKDRDGNLIDAENTVKTTAKLLLEGNIIAIKGIGGIHIACLCTLDDVILKLRKRKNRRAKPFAIMSPDIKTIRTFSILKDEEVNQLCSYRRPIVLVRKSPDYYLSEMIAPQLDTIGVFLPYSGIHYLLFKFLKEPAIIMTSANRSDEPMIISNSEALLKLRNLADYFLLHNRKIYQRADDSVLLLNNGIPTLIRRSRGYVPQWINTPIMTDDVVIALGPEERNTGCILKKGRAYFTQHIGNLTNLDQFDFEIDAIMHLMKLTRTEDANIFACDLHPQFLSTRLAFELARKKSAKVLQIQHHFAHAASLMAENMIDESMICIVCDGYGYGGGDLCTKYPVRMLISILSKIMSLDELRSLILQKYISQLRYGQKELDVILNQLEKKFNLPITTSCGRILDAAASLLNICNERTYEGEPAMKLEAVARKLNDTPIQIPLKFTKTDGISVLKTSNLFARILELIKESNIYEIAYMVHDYIARGLSTIAIEKAEDLGITKIGFSGGVAFNTIITRLIKTEVNNAGLEFIQHKKVPPGDGGVSLGQAVIAAKKHNL
ncbi:MAG: carbamoyltransferase HypF [Candidatus Helarchaeota archaeon]